MGEHGGGHTPEIDLVDLVDLDLDPERFATWLGVNGFFETAVSDTAAAAIREENITPRIS